MTGIEKVIEKINADSEILKNDIIAGANKSGEKILAEAENKGKESAAEIKEKAQEQAKNIIAMAKSGANQQTRQTLLKAKVDAVNKTLSELLKELKALPAQEYFDTVIKIAGDNALKGECTVYPCKADMSRLPSDFESKISDVLKGKGATCVLSEEGADIPSGLILDYGNIAVNCSFEAIIEENSDYYKEKISEIIF